MSQSYLTNLTLLNATFDFKIHEIIGLYPLMD